MAIWRFDVLFFAISKKCIIFAPRNPQRDYLRIFYFYINITTSKKNIMKKVSYYTAEGLKKLRDELNQLKDVERPRASQAIAEARDKGDLSENAEYDAAKEAQGLLEMKIAKLEELVANARIIDESQLDVSKVLVLSTVKLKNLANKMEITYTLVAESEADLKAGKISVSSPIGKGLLGKSVGEIAEIKVPNGTLKMEILEISR
ncbi:putative transcription elongation factor GreA [Capnocytophaga sp. oral taxon 326 str. F0382]|nr:putative transcription elongation factor GreA [Capnocytophaga sp. oral taxon 326 str. F0382]